MKNCIYLFNNQWCKLKSNLIPGESITFKICSYSIKERSMCPNFCLGYSGKPSRYISKQTRYEVLQRQGWKCNTCGKKLNYDRYKTLPGEVAYIDHIHPFSEWESYNGDINESSNLQALCCKCNGKKYNRKD